MAAVIRKPSYQDIPKIREILTKWTEVDEVDKYCLRIMEEINSKTEFNQHFWLIGADNIVIGIGGLADPLPKVESFRHQKPLN